MEKIFSPTDWDFGVESTALIKIASRGLLGADADSLVKRASDEFVHLARQVPILPGEVPLHSIAIGAHEYMGMNRNGDTFTEDTLRKYGHTFVTNAKRYRQHKNRDPAKSYGVIKLAHYNPQMHRLELLSVLNGNKEAAERNGGLVADLELERLESGKDLPTSMACKVAFDKCSICGHESATRADYCKSAEEGGHCGLFGCATGLTKVADDGRAQFVYNPRPVFFDDSWVGRKADRIASATIADYLQKAASEQRVIGGAELAELWGVSSPAFAQRTFSKRLLDHYKAANHLAQLEQELEQSPDNRIEKIAGLVFGKNQPELPANTSLGSPGSTKFAQGMKAFADREILLPLRDFAAILDNAGMKTAGFVDSASEFLPGVFNRLLSDSSLETLLRDNPYQAADVASSEMQKLAESLAATHSLDEVRVGPRCHLAAIRDISVARPRLRDLSKQASVSSEAQQLARHYALYKIAFLAARPDVLPLTAKLAVRQNYFH